MGAGPWTLRFAVVFFIVWAVGDMAGWGGFLAQFGSMFSDFHQGNER